MNGLPAKLDQLETRLRTLIEGNLSGLLPERKYWEPLIQRMMSVIKTATQVQGDGSSLAPDVFVLLVNPETHTELEIHPGLLDKFADAIREAGEKAGLKFSQPPIVTVSPNSEVERDSIEVVARNSLDMLFKTVKNEIEINRETTKIPLNSFLIVNGSRIFPLSKTVINIGRRSTNDLVIEDKRVSRDHAQMRAIRGKYVLFDLNSMGGTFVNGHRISQQTLCPRDVISLAGIPLVYGQDAIESDGLGQTEEMINLPSDDDASTFNNAV
jgi:hypothetical protein